MTSLEETAKEIKEKYPGLSDGLVATIMPNVFNRMAELNFPLDGDDTAFVEWFNHVYTPYITSIEY